MIFSIRKGVFSRCPQKGVWNVMPAREGDHGTAIGLLADADETRAFYDEIAERLGLQKKTVENHLNLALGEIRRMLKILSLLLLCWG